MPLLKRVARHGGTPWEQAIYTEKELDEDPDDGDQDVMEEMVALYLSEALDRIEVDHEIYGGFQTYDFSPSEPTFKERVDNGNLPFVARDSNLALVTLNPRNDGEIGGNVAEAGTEDILERREWFPGGSSDFHDDINDALGAIGNNMGFPYTPSNENPGFAWVNGKKWITTPLIETSSTDGAYLNLCDKWVPRQPTGFGATTSALHLYTDCVKENMQIVDKPPLTGDPPGGGGGDDNGGSRSIPDGIPIELFVLLGIGAFAISRKSD